jgi:glycosyltransferase involved in cell wall biosynthesis
VPSLCVVSPGRLAVTTDGRVQVDPKTAAGMERYAASWPGDVHFVARRGPLDERSQPFDWPRAEDLSFGVSVVDDVTGTVRALSPSVVLAPLELDSAPLLSLDARCVLVCDYPLRVRWDNVRLDPRLGSLDRLRTAAGLGRRAVGLRRMIRRAAGLQCNGPDTWSTYAHHSRNPLLYLDTRVTSDEVAQARRTPVAPDGVLRLAFSGRWIEQKGVLDAVEVVERLRADGVSVHLTLLGGGPLESRLRRHEDADVSVVGRLDFTTQWVPHVRYHVDVMVLPHPQGDSASTFLESMSCGTPVAGYDNRYWRALHADSGGGWTTPASDTRALAALLASLADDRDELARARSAGLDFAAAHSFDLEFDRRVEHLLSVTA